MNTLCQCGCGNAAPICTHTNLKEGIHRGEARRFISGHQFNIPGNRKRVRTLEELFWPRVNKREGCWEWIGGKDKDGYGKFYRQRGAAVAHRFSYELAFGPIPKNKQVLHHCDNPSCVRPDHLFLGEPKDNSADMVAKGRSIRGKCQHNAKLTPEIVVKIRSMYIPWRLSMGAVAKNLGISTSSVYDVLRGKSWRWVNRFRPA